jgi:hypothetical protein
MHSTLSCAMEWAGCEGAEQREYLSEWFPCHRLPEFNSRMTHGFTESWILERRECISQCFRICSMNRSPGPLLYVRGGARDVATHLAAKRAGHRGGLHHRARNMISLQQPRRFDPCGSCIGTVATSSCSRTRQRLQCTLAPIEAVLRSLRSETLHQRLV